MSLSQTINQACPKCGANTPFELASSLVLDGGAVTTQVVGNAFNIFKCAHCGHQARVESELLVVDRARPAYFQVVLRSEAVAQVAIYLRGLAPGAHLRVVANRDALVEKVRLWLLGLDDVAVECVKFGLRVNQRDLEGKLVLHFDRVEGEQMLIASLKAGAPPDVFPVSMAIYRRMAEEFKSSPVRNEVEIDERVARQLLLSAPPPKPAAPAAPPPAQAAPAPSTWPQLGKLSALDTVDGVGWITLDTGHRIRFGGTAMKGFHGRAPIGMRVRVLGAAPGYQGVLKATAVEPEVEVTPPHQRFATRTPRPKRTWGEFIRAYPRWSDMAEIAAPCTRAAPRPQLPPHPLFAPWLEEIAKTAPTEVVLNVADHRQPRPIDPGPEDCFSHGELAWLDTPEWPKCKRCGHLLEMCIQLSPAVMALFVPGGRGLVAMVCFNCIFDADTDPMRAFIRMVEPRHRVVRPAGPPNEQRQVLAKQSQRVVAYEPTPALPGGDWYRFRGELKGESAGSVLMEGPDSGLREPLGPGVTWELVETADEQYEEWVREANRARGPLVPLAPGAGEPAGKFGSRGCLGGVPTWAQYDRTPKCAHGEMLHLLEYDGGQFVEGELQVFLCREHRCELAFVAEF